MQTFIDFSLDMKENIPPPESWKTYPGLQATERLSIRAKVTIYIEVSSPGFNHKLELMFL